MDKLDKDNKNPEDKSETSSTKISGSLNNEGDDVENSSVHDHGKNNFLFLALAALGVVYGDIGTSPLYAIKECFTHGLALNELNILGILSLTFWSLTMVVSVKYVSFILQADNHGEGGIFSLLALVPNDSKLISNRTKSIVVMSALLGASLLYGDGIITPTISVLSAIEGLEVATEAAKPFTVPLTCLVLFGLFHFQKQGTTKIGKIFGPIMIIWFLVIAIFGFTNILKNPHVLQSINPYFAYQFFFNNGFLSFVVLGSVVLCITGGEALYADMGHFGRKPILFSWFSYVFPALLLNYMGQGALLLHDPSAISNPFYGLFPKAMIYPMVFLSTIATVIASQALISGAFSLTRQAIQMGFFPRLNIVHTSEKAEGQIYIPSVNRLMMITCIAIVLIFRESSKLAAAYGLAVTANMILTSVVYYFVITKTWGWSKYRAIPLVAFFLSFDILYFSSNMLKFFDGGWFPFTVAIFILTIMLTWKDGRAELGQRIRQTRYNKDIGTSHLSALSVQSLHGTSQLIDSLNQSNNIGLPLELLLGEALPNSQRVSGTAVFMSVSLKGIPPVLLHHLKHNQVLHEQVILLSIKSLNVPVVRGEKLEVNEIGYGFFQIKALYGFMETPNVPDIIRLAAEFGLVTDPESITYYLGRESLVISEKRTNMMRWRKIIFSFMSRNAQPATAYFSIPPSRVVELGMQLDF
ncbi:MAG: potassium transporter Kup [Candidatus Sericytochromatia bacterium]|nr:potassium transporter Kup [Candidatus Sericytochromatia bacterium]